LFLGEPTLRAWTQFTGWWLFRKSHFANLTGRALKNLNRFQAPTSDARVSIDVNAALRNVRVNGEGNFAKMVTRNSLILSHEGVDAIFALQPEIVFQQSKVRTDLEEKIYQEMVDHWPEGFVEFKNKARPMIVQMLKDAASVGGASTADLTDIYGALESTAYTDYCHLTPEGNRVLAEHVAPQIAQMLNERLARFARARSLRTFP
jgi:hypothetical protein